MDYLFGGLLARPSLVRFPSAGIALGSSDLYKAPTAILRSWSQCEAVAIYA